MSSLNSDFFFAACVQLISLTTVEGALYGIAFTVYTFCARSLYLQLEDQDRRKQHLFTLVYMSLAVALLLCGVAIDSRDMQTSFVDHVDYPGGGLLYSNIVFEGLPTAVVGYIIGILFSLMMSGIQIWRLWVIWRTSRYSLFIVVIPVLSLLAYLGFEIANLLLRSELTHGLNELFYYGLSAPLLCVSVTVTVSIIVRILVVRKRNMKLMGQANATNPYISIISMLIESFALESIWLVLSTISMVPSSRAALAINTLFSDTLPLVQLLAYLLVVFQVTMGRGWKEDTAEKLTSLQWNRDGLQTTQTDTRVSVLITDEEA